jgi:hypothetical protein
MDVVWLVAVTINQGFGRPAGREAPLHASVGALSSYDIASTFWSIMFEHTIKSSACSGLV